VRLLDGSGVSREAPAPFCEGPGVKFLRPTLHETFNTLKNQGYHLEHNYGLGEKYLSMVFFSLMMLAFLVDQLQQISCPLFRELRKKAGSKQNLWERIRAVFHLFLVDSMEMIYRVLLAGPQKVRPVFINDTS
jgi:hypothetical protein